MLIIRRKKIDALLYFRCLFLIALFITLKTKAMHLQHESITFILAFYNEIRILKIIKIVCYLF